MRWWMDKLVPKGLDIVRCLLFIIYNIKYYVNICKYSNWTFASSFMAIIWDFYPFASSLRCFKVSLLTNVDHWPREYADFFSGVLKFIFIEIQESDFWLGIHIIYKEKCRKIGKSWLSPLEVKLEPPLY